MISFNRFQRIVLLLVLALSFGLGSCSSYKLNSFNRQKFTKLKSLPTEKSNEEHFQDKSVTEDLVMDDEYPSAVHSESYADIEEIGLSDEIESPYTPEIILTDCDSIKMKNGSKIFCTIKNVGDHDISFSNCPEDGKEYEIKLSDVDYYTDGTDVIKIEEGERRLKFEDKNGQNIHQIQAREKFIGSLICLGLIGFSAFLILANMWIIGLVLITIFFFVGYILLSLSVYHSRMFKFTRPSKYRASKEAKAIYVLGILGLMLFGSFPFLVPFFIAWAIIARYSNKNSLIE